MRVGFTSTIPVEIIYAAGHTPIDLNNVFVSGKPQKMVEEAEFEGYPRNICSWIKGMYSVAKQSELDCLIGITEGDCSNTHSLMATLDETNIDIINFSYPYDKNYIKLENEIIRLESVFNVSRKKVLEMKKRLDLIREKISFLDKLTYIENKVTGFENHLWLVNSSDFNSDPDLYEKELDEFLLEAKERKPLDFDLRFAFLGVPPIITDLYDFLLEMNVNVVYNEIQRQFSMPSFKKGFIEQYLDYTFPYTVFDRVKDIREQLTIRNIDGVISYTQAFCHRQIDNIILKKKITLPFMSVEGDQPGKIDARTKLRIESFLDMIRI